MKKCSKCGAINDNLYSSCMDCGAPLGPPLSREELEDNAVNPTKAARKPFDQSDYFYVSKSDKIISILLAVGAVFLLTVKSVISHSDISDYVIIVWLVIVWMVLQAFSLLYPKLLWKFYLPGLSGKTGGNSKPQPTEGSLHLRKGLGYAAILVGYALLIIMFLDFYL